MSVPYQRLSSVLFVAANATIVGCSSAPDDAGGPADVRGGQTGEETAGCLPVRSETLAQGATSPLGFSADALLAALGSERRVPLTWDDGTTTSLQLELSYAGGDVIFSEREYRDAPSSAGLTSTAPRPELASVCNDVLTIAATLGFVTADGAFDEAWPILLSAEAANTASAYYQLDVSALAGTFRVTQVDAAAFDQLSVFATISFTQGAWTGSLSGQATSLAGPGREGSASAQTFQVATF